MVFEPSLAARAANAETAIRSILRGEYDTWVASALEQGLKACRQLLAGVEQPGPASFFSNPDTSEGVLFFKGEFHERSREVLQQLVADLDRLVNSRTSAETSLEDLERSLQIFRSLSLALCRQDQLIQRTLA